MMAKVRPVFKIAAFLLSAFACGPASAQTTAAIANPFELLLGKWGGSGMMTLEGGRKQRLACDASYSGSALQLVIIINCKGGESKVQMQAKLSSNAGRLLGIWEEKSYRVAGSISGVATQNKISFNILGAVQGKMNVSYSKTRQQVNITAKGVSLQAVTMNLTRR
jgi:hypothetical protein